MTSINIISLLNSLVDRIKASAGDNGVVRGRGKQNQIKFYDISQDR